MKKEEKQFFVSSVLLILTLLPVSYSHHAPVTYLSFSDTIAEKFSHITIHDTTGRVYIGAVNRIYQLTEDLNLEHNVLMGPHDDSPNCPVTRNCPDVKKNPTDYYNKALLIDYTRSKLLACGSLFQGVCTLHDLNDVSTYRTAANESVVANTGAASTVAFTAPGPDVFGQPQVLYVGASFSGNGHYASDVPSVSSRSLDPSSMLEIFHSSSTLHTSIFVNSLFREIYPITHVYGFSSEGFSYFVTVQKQSYGGSGPFISKLVRICQNDANYYSYTEVPLSCKASDGTDYNLAQAAYVKRAGHELATHLDIQDKDVLFVVFAKSQDTENNEPSPNSALCSYSMPVVRHMFTQNIQHCYDGNAGERLEFITPILTCYPVRYQIEDDFCGLEVNTPLGGTIRIETTPVLRFPGVLITAVAATSTQDHTVVFLGTSTGHLKKAVIETAGTASEYADIVIEEGSPVNPDLVFDRTKDHIYVMTQKMVTKVDVEECERFHSCSACLEGGDPRCGWCLTENRCLLRKACTESGHDSFCWFSYKSNQCYASTGREAFNKTSERVPELAGSTPVVESSKLTTLKDIAQSMRNIDKSLRELIALQKQKK